MLRSAVEQLVDASQTRAVAAALGKLRGRQGALTQLLDWLESEMDAKVRPAGRAGRDRARRSALSCLLPRAAHRAGPSKS
jgi:hypothetical protein